MKTKKKKKKVPNRFDVERMSAILKVILDEQEAYSKEAVDKVLAIILKR